MTDDNRIMFRGDKRTLRQLAELAVAWEYNTQARGDMSKLMRRIIEEQHAATFGRVQAQQGEVVDERTIPG